MLRVQSLAGLEIRSFVSRVTRASLKCVHLSSKQSL